MNRAKAEAIVVRLLANAAGVRYGSVSIMARVHDGRVVDVTYSTTESTREPEPKRDMAGKDEVAE
jgi:hypothetical protein